MVPLWLIFAAGMVGVYMGVGKPSQHALDRFLRVVLVVILFTPMAMYAFSIVMSVVVGIVFFLAGMDTGGTLGSLAYFDALKALVIGWVNGRPDPSISQPGMYEAALIEAGLSILATSLSCLALGILASRRPSER